MKKEEKIRRKEKEKKVKKKEKEKEKEKIKIIKKEGVIKKNKEKM